MSIKVAYLTSVYPRASDSFVREEIASLRKLDVEVVTYSIRRPPPEQLVTNALAHEASQTTYLLGEGWLRLLATFIFVSATRPIKMLRGVSLLVRSHPAGLINRLKQLAYMVEAAALVTRLEQQGIRHVHNHIGENSATVAMLASCLGSASYSHTVHGPGLFFHPRQWALREKIHRAAATICISRFCMSQCMIFSDLDDWPKLRIVRCGVGRAFLDTPPEVPASQARLLCVGRLCQEKGHHLLLGAVKRLVSDGISVELRIVGDGEQRDTLQEKITQWALGDHVKILGWASAETIRHELSQSRALVLPSFAEGLPVVFMEALAMRRPVIATQVAGIPELVVAGENGWVIPPADETALYHAMRDCLSASPDTLLAMGKAGWERVSRDHDCDREAAKLKCVFVSVLQGSCLPTQDALEAEPCV